MEFEYSTYRNREGTFYHPCINLTFKYKSKSLFAVSPIHLLHLIQVSLL